MMLLPHLVRKLLHGFSLVLADLPFISPDVGSQPTELHPFVLLLAGSVMLLRLLPGLKVYPLSRDNVGLIALDFAAGSLFSVGCRFELGNYLDVIIVPAEGISNENLTLCDVLLFMVIHFIVISTLR